VALVPLMLVKIQYIKGYAAAHISAVWSDPLPDKVLVANTTPCVVRLVQHPYHVTVADTAPVPLISASTVTTSETIAIVADCAFAVTLLSNVDNSLLRAVI
jgi:hypothetical protein